MNDENNRLDDESKDTDVYGLDFSNAIFEPETAALEDKINQKLDSIALREICKAVKLPFPLEHEVNNIIYRITSLIIHFLNEQDTDNLDDIIKMDVELQRCLLVIVKSSGMFLENISNIELIASRAITILNAARISFSRMDLARIRTPGANLRYSIMIGTDLQGTDLHRGNLRGANLDGANLRGANLDRANLRGANLDGANLRGANLDGANLARANLRGANLDGANLARANLREANLATANLKQANLEEAILDRAVLIGANLPEAYLPGAYLPGAYLPGAYSPGVNLRGAYLEELNLEEKNLALKLRLDSANPAVAADVNYIEFVKTAVSQGAHLIQIFESGNTALHFALIKNQLLKATILLQQVIEMDPDFFRLLNIKNTAGETVLDLCKRIQNIPDELRQCIEKISNFQHQDAKSKLSII